MPKKKFKLFIGILLLLVAAFCGLMAFYFLEVKPELAARHSTVKTKKQIPSTVDSKVTFSNKSTPTVTTASSAPPAPPAEKTISLKALVQEANAVYNEEEKNKKEGVLWVDRQSSKFIVTLGAINGILAGDYLTVYDGSRRLGQVKVESVFDSICFVQPLAEATNALANDYYRVVIE